MLTASQIEKLTQLEGMSGGYNQGGLVQYSPTSTVLPPLSSLDTFNSDEWICSECNWKGIPKRRYNFSQWKDDESRTKFSEIDVCRECNFEIRRRETVYSNTEADDIMRSLVNKK